MTTPASSPLRWPWLFPLTYLLHGLEEYTCGETFPVWISRLARVEFTSHAFLVLNALALAAMVAAVSLAITKPRLRWLLAALGVIVAVNGALHALGSLVTRSYSPGLLTGVLLWLPLGVLTLGECRRSLSVAALRLGILAGIVAHAAVSACVLLL